jgi:hypothetical protein
VWRWRLPRHPEVFVRDLSMAEGQRLQKITRTAKDPIRLRRAIVVLMSAQGQAVSDIVDLLHVDEGRFLVVVANLDRKDSQCRAGRGTRHRDRPTTPTRRRRAQRQAASLPQ